MSSQELPLLHSPQMGIPKARLAGFYFAYFVLLGAYVPYWSLYLEHIGFAKAQIGILTFISVCSRIIAPSFWGYLADKTGKRLWLVQISTTAQLLAWIGIYFAPKLFIPIACILFVAVFFQNAILAQFEAITLYWLKDNKHEYGFLRLWGSIGFAVAVVAGGYCFDLVEITQLVPILIVVSAVASLSAYLVHEPPYAPHEHIQTVPIWQVIKRPQVYGFFIVALLVLISHAPFYTFYSNYLQSYGYSKSSIGLLWGAGIIAEVTMFTQVPKVINRFNRQYLVAFCIVITALRWVLVAQFPSFAWVQVLAQSFHAFSFALFHTLAISMITSEFTPNQQGRAQGLYNTVWGLGVAFGSVVAGNIWDTVTGVGVFYIAALVCLSSLMVMFVVNGFQRTKHPTA